MTAAPRSGPWSDGSRTLVMGVVNVTPDSFSDGGAWFEPEAAVEHGRALVADGADLIDIGGESTRPGARRPSVTEELRRTIPVVGELARTGVPVSIDTMRAQVAAAALDAGAAMVNDVSGGLADPDMLTLVAERHVPFIAMHWRGHSADMQSRAEYADAVADVRRELSERVDAALSAGVAAELLVLDPGLGFAKTAEHNWSLLAQLPVLHTLGYPILVGASRKAFLGKVGRGPDQSPRPPGQRDVATAATTVYAAQAGAWAVRVHDVRGSRAALDVLAAMDKASRPGRVDGGGST